MHAKSFFAHVFLVLMLYKPKLCGKLFACGCPQIKKNDRHTYIFLVAKLLYNYECPSVCPYVRLGGNAIFSVAKSWRFPLSMSISVIILSVGLSVRLQEVEM